MKNMRAILSAASLPLILLLATLSLETSVAAPTFAEETARLFDTYPDIRFNDEKARLDNFVIAIRGEPGSKGYIVVYGQRACVAGEARARANRARAYLVNTRGLENYRLVTATPGYRDELTVELYLVPAGSTLPPFTPTYRRCQPQRRR
jgi:hypothetical protein